MGLGKAEKGYQKCSACGKGELKERIKSRKIFKFLFFYKVRHYKCSVCENSKHIFYKR